MRIDSFRLLGSCPRKDPECTRCHRGGKCQRNMQHHYCRIYIQRTSDHSGLSWNLRSRAKVLGSDFQEKGWQRRGLRKHGPWLSGAWNRAKKARMLSSWSESKNYESSVWFTLNLGIQRNSWFQELFLRNRRSPVRDRLNPSTSCMS